jgi:hypothetical protein
MSPLLAILESSDYIIIAFLVLVSAAVASLATRRPVNLRRLERKLDALLQHEGIEMPSRLSPGVQCLDTDPRTKIAAIKLHREENPELSLAEAKAEIEAFARTIQ